MGVPATLGAMRRAGGVLLVLASVMVSALAPGGAGTAAAAAAAQLAGLTRCASPGWPTARPGSTGSVPARRWRRPAAGPARAAGQCVEALRLQLSGGTDAASRDYTARRRSGRGVLLRGRPADRPGARPCSRADAISSRAGSACRRRLAPLLAGGGRARRLQDMQAVRAELPCRWRNCWLRCRPCRPRRSRPPPPRWFPC